MNLRNLKKVREKFLDANSYFEENHPATYKYSEIGNMNNPPLLVMKYAVKKPDGGSVLDYETAVRHIEKGARNRPFNEKSSAYDVIEYLLDLDETSYVSGIGPKVEKTLSLLYQSTRNSPGSHNVSDRICVLSGMAILSEYKTNARYSDIDDLSEDSLNRIYRAVNKSYEVDESNSKSNNEQKNDSMLESDESESESSTVLDSKYFATVDDHLVWLYAKMKNRTDIAEELVQGRPQNISSYNHIERIANKSRSASELSRYIQESDDIRFSPEQQRKWPRLEEIIRDASENDIEPIVAVVNNMSSTIELGRRASGDDSEESVIIKQDSKNTEDWLDEYEAPEDPDNYDPRSVPSTLFRNN